MPIWPLSLRRRKTTITDSVPPTNLHSVTQPVAQPAHTPSVSRRRRASKQNMGEKSDVDVIAPVDNEKTGRNEDITALPIKWRLDHSPHLRPVDADREKAQIPYNFLNSPSQTSVPRTDTATSSKPGTLRSKRSTFDGSVSIKRRSTQKRGDEKMREEEIREMSASMPQPKRPGDGPLRRDSYKRRTYAGNKESAVSLPPAQKDPSAPTVVESSGWEIKEFWYNPRPPVRLSKVPAYTWNSPSVPQLPLARNISQKVKESESKARASKSRHRTVGAAADGLDSSDLRAVLERDAKRKQERDRRRTERLEKKLRAAGRARTASNVSNKLADKAIEASPFDDPKPASVQHVEDVHPALRDSPTLGAIDTPTITEAQELPNPFMTPAEYDSSREAHEEDPVVQTAREVRMSTATTPPLSPVDRDRRLSAFAPIEPLPPASPAYISPPQSPKRVDEAAAPPIADTASRSDTKRASRRMSQPKDSKRNAGAWASFFKRTGTQKDADRPEAQTSFANTSRESMGRQPLPPHLVTTIETSPFPKRTKSGPPIRTQSKFREDLPDAPMSPPESRIQSPVSEMPLDAAMIAAAAAAASAAQPAKVSPPSIAAAVNQRSDTPVSPVHSGVDGVMAASLASVDSEASWLASGGSVKRASLQSAPRRSMGSMTARRTPDFQASYEDLHHGSVGDRDAEYVSRTSAARRSAQLSGAAVAGASRDDDGVVSDLEDIDESEIAVPVHGSVRRKATLVHRDPSVRSREGLLSEYTAGVTRESSAVQYDSDVATDDEVEASGSTRLEKARSIDYKGHARQVSAGSARLLDVAPRRVSQILDSPTTPVVKEQGSQM